MAKNEDKERGTLAAEDLDNVHGGAVALADLLVPNIADLRSRVDTLTPRLREIRLTDTLRVPSPFQRFGIASFEEDTGRS